jgi:hypothetical protein
MAQYAILIYTHDSAHAPDATPEDTESCDRHSDELVESGSMVVAYALTPRDMATSIRGDTITGDTITDGPAIARLNPVVRDGGGVEVRPVHSYFVKPEKQREEQTTT